MTKYLEDGTEVELLGEFDGGVVVQHQYESYHGEPHWSDPYIASRVYDEPPTTRKHAEIASLDEAIRDRQRQASELHRSILAARNSLREYEQRLKELSKLPNLDTLWAAVHGEITHLAILGYKPTIAEMDSEELRCPAGSGRHKEELRLLSVWGTSRSNCYWKLSMYSDGSGSSERVYPCTSYDQARGVLQAELDKQTAEQAARSSYWQEAAESHNLTLPEGTLEIVADQRRVALTERHEKALRALQEAEAELSQESTR